MCVCMYVYVYVYVHFSILRYMCVVDPMALLTDHIRCRAAIAQERKKCANKTTISLKPGRDQIVQGENCDNLQGHKCRNRAGRQKLDGS